MRRIDNLVVHCTATRQSATIESIQRYWREVLKWKNPGYHIIITPSGAKVRLQPDELLANGVAGNNSHSLHVSYIGGIDDKGKSLDNRTPEQKKALAEVLTEWMNTYKNARIIGARELRIMGHRDFPGVTKRCPSFDAKTEYSYIK